MLDYLHVAWGRSIVQGSNFKTFNSYITYIVHYSSLESHGNGIIMYSSSTVCCECSYGSVCIIVPCNILGIFLQFLHTIRSDSVDA